MIQLTLPYPPTANSVWRHPTTGRLAGRHLLSAESRTYRAAVHGCVLDQLRRYPRLAGRLAVRIEVWPPDKRRRDLSNIPKAVEDALTHAQVWLDDSQIDELHLVRRSVGGMLKIEIREAA